MGGVVHMLYDHHYLHWFRFRNYLGVGMNLKYRDSGQTRERMVAGRILPRRRTQSSWDYRSKMVAGRIAPVSDTDTYDRMGRRRQDTRTFLTTSSQYGDFLHRNATERPQSSQATDSINYRFFN